MGTYMTYVALAGRRGHRREICVYSYAIELFGHSHFILSHFFFIFINLIYQNKM